MYKCISIKWGESDPVLWIRSWKKMKSLAQDKYKNKVKEDRRKYRNSINMVNQRNALTQSHNNLENIRTSLNFVFKIGIRIILGECDGCQSFWFEDGKPLPILLNNKDFLYELQRVDFFLISPSNIRRILDITL